MGNTAVVEASDGATVEVAMTPARNPYRALWQRVIYLTGTGCTDYRGLRRDRWNGRDRDQD